MQRLIVALGTRVETADVPVPLYVFPSAERIQSAFDVENVLDAIDAQRGML